MFQFKSLSVWILVLSLTACGKKLTETNNSDGINLLSIDPTESVVESGISALDGVADEQANASLASLSKPIQFNKFDFVKSLLVPEAYAAVCERAYAQTCNSGVKQVTYAGCTNVTGQASLNGDVGLSYSHGSCTLSSAGDSVTRTYDLNITGPRGGIFAITSDNETDYLGQTYGGGGKLTKTSSGFDIEIMGKHKSFVYNNRLLYDVSMRTTSPIGVTGTIARVGRTVSGGTMEIHHNLAKFTAAITPNNLTYSNVCCHPVAGTLAINYSGSVTGNATLTFNGCGSATYIKAGQAKDITLSYCE